MRQHRALSKTAGLDLKRLPDASEESEQTPERHGGRGHALRGQAELLTAVWTRRPFSPLVDTSVQIPTTSPSGLLGNC